MYTLLTMANGKLHVKVYYYFRSTYSPLRRRKHCSDSFSFHWNAADEDATRELYSYAKMSKLQVIYFS